eukprot:gene865-159_t
MDQDHDYDQSKIPCVEREKTINVEDSHKSGTVSQTEDLEPQLLAYLRQLKPEILKPELRNESYDFNPNSFVISTQPAPYVSPSYDGDETSLDKMRGQAPYKGRKSLEAFRTQHSTFIPSASRSINPVKSGDNIASTSNIPAQPGDHDAQSAKNYSSQSEGEIWADDEDQISVMASNASYPHRQSLTNKKEADILSLLKAHSNKSKRHSES